MDDREWAAQEFGDADLGDARRGFRLVQMAARAAARPSGVVAEVFEVPSERQAAYDLLGSSRVPSEKVVEATARATARRCSDSKVVRLVIDGTSASLADQAKLKELGSVGVRRFPTRGLKVVDACAVDERGVPMGLLALRAWARGPKRNDGRFVRRRDGKTEMAEQWIPALEEASTTLALHAPNARVWVVGDRECDNTRFLRTAAGLGTFTVRAAQNRLVETEKGRQRKLFSVARAGRLVATRIVHVPATSTRRKRVATIEIRISRMKVLLPLHDDAHSRQALPVNVVELREVSRCRNRLVWTLVTNAAVDTVADVDEIVASYRARWRIEEFHRSWKAGACDMESTQLRRREAITKWVTILGAVAARAERLKLLSRTDPDAPATIELTSTEIVALITAKRRIKTSVEVVPDGVPSIALATRWIADVGGWAGHYKRFAPGTTTIARGLERLATWTEAVTALVPPREIKRRLR